MLKSMTAYACEEISRNEVTVGVEIRAYNSRHLDVALRVPAGFAPFEEKIKSTIGACVMRGRIEIRLRIKDFSEQAFAYEVDTVKAKAYQVALKTLKEALQVTGEATLMDLAALPGVIQPAENNEVIETYWPLVLECLTKALETLDRMRRVEGEHIRKDFVERLDLIENHLDNIEQVANAIPEQYRDKLRTRIETLTKGLVELDSARIAQEAAILADRSDISEEVVRARSHLAQFRGIIDSDLPSGRELNFLLQEFNREFNTMGSKIGQADVAHTIVTIKAELEKLREQVQNIE